MHRFALCIGAACRPMRVFTKAINAEVRAGRSYFFLDSGTCNAGVSFPADGRATLQADELKRSDGDERLSFPASGRATLQGKKTLP